MTSVRHDKSQASASILGLIISAGIAFQAFGSVYFPEVLGYLGSSPGSILLLIALPFSILSTSMNTTARIFAFLFIWGILMSVVYLIILGFNQLFFDKFINTMILISLWVSPIFLIDSVEKDILVKGVITGLVILLAGYLLSDILQAVPAWAQAMLFGNDTGVYLDSRARAFMTETSHFSGLFGRYAICLILLLEVGRQFSAGRLFTGLAAIGAVLFVIEGKGAAIALIFAMGAAALNRKSLPYLLLIIPLGVLIGSAQFEALGIDIEKFTSTSTRSVMTAAGLLSLTSNPFGFGYYGFYHSISEFGAAAADVAAGFGMNLTEVDNIIYNLENVSSKSTLMDFLIIFGLPFLIVLFLIIRSVDLKDPRVLSSLVFFLTLALSTSGNESIPFFLGLAILIKFYPSERLRSPR